MVGNFLITLKAILFHTTLHHSPTNYYLFLWIVFLIVNTTSHTARFITEFHCKGTAITVDITTSYIFFAITIILIITNKKLHRLWAPTREIIGVFTFLSQVFVVSEMYYRVENNKNVFLLSYIALTFNGILVFNETAPNAIKPLIYQTLLFLYSVFSFVYRPSVAQEMLLSRKVLQWYAFTYAIALLNTYYLMKLRYENIYKILALEKTLNSWRKVMDLTGIGISIETEQKVLYRNKRFAKIQKDEDQIQIDFVNNKPLKRSILNSKSISLPFPQPIVKNIINDNNEFKISQMPIFFENTNSFIYIVKDIKQIRQEEQSKYSQLLIATITHELRTPLNITTAILSLLSEKITDRNIKEDISKALCASLFQETLINDILDLAKLNNGELTINATPIDIRSCLKHLCDLFKYRIDKEIKFSLTIRDGTPELLKIDDRRYKQILLNLLSNSSKFTNQGFIKVESYFEEGCLYTTVSDSGIGINEKDRDKIFKQFGMLENATNKSGTGLGLHLCKVIAEKMGGHIYFESVPNVETKFEFTIKVEQWSDIKLVDAQKVHYDRVLIVDDNLMNVEILKSFCKKKALPFSAFTDSKEAYAAIAKNHYFFIGFLDLQMPGMDGYELAVALRTAQCNCYLIAVTGEDRQTVCQRCFQSGFDQVIEKPIAYETFNRLT